MIITNLLTNMAVLTLQGAIPMNTPAFQEYVFNAMWTNANAVASRWHLGKDTICTNKITFFKATPFPSGFTSGMIFGERYAFRVYQGEFDGFSDKPFNCQVFLTDDVKTNDAVLEKWMRATNLLTMKKARQIADSTMRSVGVPVDKMGFKKPDVAGQWKYEWKDGKTYLLPYYKFEWGTDKGSCRVEVSGITSNVVDFFFTGPYLRLPKPTNYLEMLGLPTNTVFVKRVFMPPGYPLTYETYPP